jgi:Flp pilus assembly protein TadD
MRSKIATLLPILLLALTVPTWGQAWAGKGRLQGQVKDESGKPIQGAEVILRKDVDEHVDPETPGPEPILTNKNGKWSILGLAGGEWGILIQKEGLMPSEGRVKVNEFGPAQPINVTLNAIPEEVVRKAEQESAAGQAKAALERANALLAQGKHAEARAAYEEGLVKLPDTTLHPAVLRAIADTWYKEGNVDKAVEALNKALEVSPEDPDTLRLIASLLVASNREEEAAAYLDRLPEGVHMDPDTILNVGIEAFNDGDMDKALRQFDRVVKENPSLPDPYYYRGLVYLNLGKTAEAKADLQKLLELDPNHRNAAEARDFLKSL